MFIPDYIRSGGPDAIKEYRDAQERMYELYDLYKASSAEADMANEKAQKLRDKRRDLIDRFPTLDLQARRD